MFANEHEVCALYETKSLDAAMEELAKHACIAVVTRSGEGAVVLEGGRRHVVAGERVANVVDTTGAGDMFAGGFMTGLVQGGLGGLRADGEHRSRGDHHALWGARRGGFAGAGEGEAGVKEASGGWGLGPNPGC